MNLSQASKDVIAESRCVAEKLDNDFVGNEHFLLAYNKYRNQSFKDLKVSISDKKELINYIRGIKISGASIDEDFPLTKEFERVLYLSNFQRWVINGKSVEPEHIHLSILFIDVKQKKEYYRVLNINSIVIGSFKKLMIDIQFNPILRMLGIAKLFRLLV